MAVESVDFQTGPGLRPTAFLETNHAAAVGDRVRQRGHAQVVIDAMVLSGIAVAAVIDEVHNAASASNANGPPICRSWREAVEQVGESLPVIVAVGRNSARHRIAGELQAVGAVLHTVCHPTAVVSPRARIGAGCYIGAKAIVNRDAVVGDACIVNSGACVEHHCRLRNAVHLGPLAVLCGWASAGDRAFIGASASVRDRVSVGVDAVVGMGSVVVSDVAGGAVVVGCPVRPMRGCQRG